MNTKLIIALAGTASLLSGNIFIQAGPAAVSGGGTRSAPPTAPAAIKSPVNLTGGNSSTVQNTTGDTSATTEVTTNPNLDTTSANPANAANPNANAATATSVAPTQSGVTVGATTGGTAAVTDASAPIGTTQATSPAIVSTVHGMNGKTYLVGQNGHFYYVGTGGSLHEFGTFVPTPNGTAGQQIQEASTSSQQTGVTQQQVAQRLQTRQGANGGFPVPSAITTPAPTINNSGVVAPTTLSQQPGVTQEQVEQRLQTRQAANGNGVPVPSATTTTAAVVNNTGASIPNAAGPQSGVTQEQVQQRLQTRQNANGNGFPVPSSNAGSSSTTAPNAGTGQINVAGNVLTTDGKTLYVGSNGFLYYRGQDGGLHIVGSGQPE